MEDTRNFNSNVLGVQIFVNGMNDFKRIFMSLPFEQVPFLVNV